MFDCASEIPENSGFEDYLTEFGWTIDNSASLFAQINRSDVLTEFMNAVISPISAAPRVQGRKPAEIFISYAHEDEEFRIQLEKHLSVLRRRGVIELWHDRKITPGREWKGEIDAHVDSADVTILLISEDFLDSDYCYDVELSRALERHDADEAVVIPVILKPVDWEGAPFGKLAALPTDARPITNWRSRAAAFADVARGIRREFEEFPRQR
jgi:TIR domain-containing protein